MEQHILDILITYKYWVMFPVAFVEGPFVSMVSGFLIKLGYMTFLPAYLILMAGDLVGDVMWYKIGNRYGHRFVRRFGKYFSISEDGIATVTRIFQTHHTAILIVSKITMGFGFAIVTLFTAGLTGVPFKKYMALNFFGQLIWTGVLMAVGFMLGNFYITANHWLGRVSIIAVFVILFFALLGFGKYMRKRMTAKIS